MLSFQRTKEISDNPLQESDFIVRQMASYLALRMRKNCDEWRSGYESDPA